MNVADFTDNRSHIQFTRSFTLYTITLNSLVLFSDRSHIL
ncbi:hypothetical protein CIPAW_13G049400 [Carya illinoinensis]|uniref:Uncharacterized protein n=1 Tax=Carya illinoinensis TaxID=32201 RepID=A0A8T1NGA4_CARIL|nr:hypothetical protein CIPAW_13G049400 [Carya illinoinensis]